MKIARMTAIALAMASVLIAAPSYAQENGSGDPMYRVEAPSGFAMVGDLLIARPLLIGATAIGVGAFIVSLPFTALGGNVGEAGKALVVEPGASAFVRCLGCTEVGYKKQ